MCSGQFQTPSSVDAQISREDVELRKAGATERLTMLAGRGIVVHTTVHGP
jgi:hypothetical protein